MQRTILATVLLLSLLGSVDAVQVNPIGKVLELLSSLEAKIKAEGETEVKAYEEFADWCHDSAMNTGFEIKTGKKEKEDLEAAINKHTADIEADDASIEDLTKSITASEADLNAAKEVRKQERIEFKAVETELVDAIGTMERAIVVIEREMAKNPGFLQRRVDTANVQAVLQTLEAVIDSAGMQGSDRQRLMSLVQNRGSDEDADAGLDMGAPAAAAYQSHSSSITDILGDLKEKAEEELATARNGETSAQHNFDMLKQSLEDKIEADSKELSETKTAKASSGEAKSTAEGDLAMTVKALANAEANLVTIESDCTTAAADHEASMKSRAEELKALKEAKEIIESSTSGAVEQQYSALQAARTSYPEGIGDVIESSAGDAADHRYSLLQIAKASLAEGVLMHSMVGTRAALANMKFVSMLKKLAKQQNSSVIALLASRVSAVIRYGAAGGEDPFAKVKEMISQLIAKLESDADADATQKAYCDAEMKETSEKKAELKHEIEKLTTKIDKASANSAKLKEDVAELEKELGEITKMQAEMDVAREDEHGAFVKAKADLEQGVAGVQGAIKVLREYYGSASLIQQPEMPAKHTKAEGAGSSIIGILEICESDFSKTLAEETIAEEEAQSEYDKMSMENKMSKTMKEQDVKYKTKESASLEKAISEHSSDKDGLQTELSAVLEYNEKLEEMCVAKPESYAERKGRREAEINGLKDALKSLEGEAFLQRRSIRRM